jgi:hypothetical protein
MPGVQISKTVWEIVKNKRKKRSLQGHKAHAQDLDGSGLSKRIRSVGLIQLHLDLDPRVQKQQAHNNTFRHTGIWHLSRTRA